MATGISGNDCPVPKGGFLGMISAAEHDSWCDCMYGADPITNAKCKLKAGLDPSTWKYGPLPWTLCGIAIRDLPGAGSVGGICKQAANAAEQAANDAVKQVLNGKDPRVAAGDAAVAAGVPANVVNLVTDTTHPAASPNPTPNSTPVDQSTYTRNLTVKAQQALDSSSRLNAQLTAARAINFTMPSSSNLLLYGGIALAGFLVYRSMSRRGPVSGFGGYSKRRRRSRR